MFIRSKLSYSDKECQRVNRYVKPIIEVMDVNIESGVAAGSSRIIPVGPNDDENIEVKDWVNEDKGTYDIDL